MKLSFSFNFVSLVLAVSATSLLADVETDCQENNGQFGCQLTSDSMNQQPLLYDVRNPSCHDVGCWCQYNSDCYLEYCVVSKYLR